MQSSSPSGGTRSLSFRSINLHSLARLLRAASADDGPGFYFEPDNDDGDDDELYEDDEDDYSLYEPRQITRPTWHEEIKEPVEEGVELLYSGDFGRIGPKSRSRRKVVNIARQILSQSSVAIPETYREELISVCLQHLRDLHFLSVDRTWYLIQMALLWQNILPTSILANSPLVNECS